MWIAKAFRSISLLLVRPSSVWRARSASHARERACCLSTRVCPSLSPPLPWLEEAESQKPPRERRPLPSKPELGADASLEEKNAAAQEAYNQEGKSHCPGCARGFKDEATVCLSPDVRAIRVGNSSTHTWPLPVADLRIGQQGRAGARKCARA